MARGTIQIHHGIITNNGHHLFAIGGMTDHIHILVSLSPTQSLSDLVRIIKSNSTAWINEKGFIRHKFAWQEGFGAFSYSKSQIPQVSNYIQNQEDHHRHKTFREEYIIFLEKFGIDYSPQYIFKDVE